MKKGFFKKGAFRRGIVAALTAAMLSTEVFGVSGLAGVLTAYAAEAAAADASANDASENDASENSTSENSATEDVVVVPEGFNSNIAKISVSYDSLALVAGQKVKVDAVYTAENQENGKAKVDDKFVVWTTSDVKVVNVDNSGNVSAIGKGDAKISITTLDKPSVKAEIAVHVGDDDEVYVVPSMTLQVKEQKKIDVTLGGKVVYGAKFTLVDGKKFAGVNKKSGVVTAKKEGTAKVKVEYKGESKEVTINVKD
ncbi:MAG: Ig-like domain-containing protein, partial [Lachnospiraceae bacterium]|nr:Ig-like domain-containing protein [Lachnospiraceae bacterium]